MVKTENSDPTEPLTMEQKHISLSRLFKCFKTSENAFSVSQELTAETAMWL